MRPAHIPSRLQLGHFQWRDIAAALAFVAFVAGILAAAAGLFFGLPLFEGVPCAAKWGVYAASAAGLLCMAYGVLVEPWTLRVESLELSTPKLCGTLRLAHVSDLHLRRWGRVEDSVLAALRDLKPDLILFTGDFGTSSVVVDDVRRFVRELCAVAPTYCSRGNHEYRSHCPDEALRDLGAAWLLNSKVRLDLPGGAVEILGVDAGDEAAVRALQDQLDPAAYSVLLYHYPDLVPELGRMSCDLMLCGHTHGGQVRLPGLGALVCMSRSGTPYSQGLFRSGEKAAYVSRGIGCESYGLPRIRFLCPPEITLLTIMGEQRTTESGKNGIG